VEIEREQDFDVVAMAADYGEDSRHDLRIWVDDRQAEMRGEWFKAFWAWLLSLCRGNR